jgi:hypothetical protein
MRKRKEETTPGLLFCFSQKGTEKNVWILYYSTFEDAAIDRPETSVRNYQSTLRQIPEERRSRNHELYQIYCSKIL